MKISFISRVKRSKEFIPRLEHNFLWSTLFFKQIDDDDERQLEPMDEIKSSGDNLTPSEK